MCESGTVSMFLHQKSSRHLLWNWEALDQLIIPRAPYCLENASLNQSGAHRCSPGLISSAWSHLSLLEDPRGHAHCSMSFCTIGEMHSA